MKNILKILSFFVLFAMFSCSSPDFSLQGKWVVERVNFDFDERKNTPEMIEQLGREESKNELIFKNDSIVYVKMSSYDADYLYSIDENSNIKFGTNTPNNILGVLKENKIYSEQNTAIGKMRITFVKN